MTRSNIYTLLCTTVRLAAVYLFVEVVAQVVSAITSLRAGFETFVVVATMTQPIAQFILSLLLWFFPGVLARVAASKKSLETFESDVSAETLQYLAFSILGLWFAIIGLSQLAYTAHRWIFLDVYLRQNLLNPTQDPKVYGTLLSEVVKTVLGLALALGSRGLVGMFRRFREAGLHHSSRELSDSQ